MVSWTPKRHETVAEDARQNTVADWQNMNTRFVVTNVWMKIRTEMNFGHYGIAPRCAPVIRR
jgi:hypothetical protein